MLIQKEVAQRICARPGTGDYGAFTLLMQYYTEPELLFTVPNTCPPPKRPPWCGVTQREPPAGGEEAFWRRCQDAGEQPALPKKSG